MATQPYLIFSLHNTRYAIAAQKVREIFFLPELTPVAESPPDVVGLLNLHSKFVPVMHLDLRFGHKFERCHVTDSVIMVESQELQVGIIVNQVETVSDIDDQYIQTGLSYGREQNIHQAFVEGIINLDDETVILLNVDNLVRYSDALANLSDPENIGDSEAELTSNNFYEQYFTDASLNTRKILHQRAISLKESTDDLATTELIPLAVVSIAGRYFGLDLDVVREFTNIGRVTLIPCCPKHIIGNMNLRGEILTLVDICHPLNLATTNHRQARKAVVIEVNDIVAGLVVEEVHDIIDFRPESLKPIPVATDSSTASYLKGVADYQNQTLNVIDLTKLLAQGTMTVELTT